MISFVGTLTKMRKKLHKLLFYTLLAGVYGIFFSVESFYNFEGQTDVKGILAYASLIKVNQQSGGPRARTAPLRSASSHGLRLNKRYHQEVISPCPVLLPVRPEYVLTPLSPVCDRHADLNEPALLYRPQRGPPALS
jgi:hypothetical protein